MPADILVRTLFTDSGVSAGLARLNSGIHDIAKAAPGGARGLNAVESGMRALASEAVGLQGPIGRIAEGLLKFGGGSALILGVTAGIGLIAAAYKAFTQDARDAEKAQTDFIESLNKTPEERAIRARNRLAAAQAAAVPLSFGGGVPIIPQEALLAVSAAQNEVTVAEKAATVWARDRTQEIEKQNVAIEEQAGTMRELARLAAEIAKGQPELENVALRMIPQVPSFERFRAIQEVESGTTKQLVDQISTRLIGVGMGHAAPAIPSTTAKPSGVDAGRLAAESVALLGALQGGQGGGAISALGGIAGSIKGIPSPVGLALTAFGGVFSVFDHSEERRHKEMMRTLNKIAERPLPEAVRVQPIFIGTENRAQTIYEAQRREDRDAISRGVGGP